MMIDRTDAIALQDSNLAHAARQYAAAHRARVDAELANAGDEALRDAEDLAHANLLRLASNQALTGYDEA